MTISDLPASILLATRDYLIVGSNYGRAHGFCK
jgi:hypothetical protein